MHKLQHIHTIEHYFVLRNELTNHEHSWKNLMRITSWEKPSEDYILWFQPYNILKKAKLWRQWKKSVVARSLVGGKNEEVNHRFFRVMELFCLILKWSIQVIMVLSKNIEHNTEDETCRNHGLWLIMLCQSIEWNKYTNWWRLLIGEVFGYGNRHVGIVYISPSLGENLKLF